MNTEARIAFAFTLLAAPLSCFAQLYSIEVIGPINSLSTYTSALNNSGQVLGWFGSQTDTLYLSSGGVVSFPGNLGGLFPTARGLNDAGDFVGQYLHNGNTHAYVSNGGVTTDLGSLGGQHFSGATDINNAGQIVGQTSTDNSSGRAFLYSGGVMNDLGTLGGSTSSGSAINEFGEVAGYSTMLSGAYHAFRYSSGVMTDLGTLGGKDSFSADINAFGQVVGYSNFSFASDVDSHAFVYGPGGIKDLGTLGGKTSWATAINDSGYIVGASDTGQGYHPFLFDGQAMLDLNSLVDVNAAGLLYLSSASDINASGQISGSAVDANGRTVGYLLTPLAPASAVPEPSTYAAVGALLLLGLGAQRSQRRRPTPVVLL